MRPVLIEKRIAGIIRWLERMKKSYTSGAMESALMEAECAKADLEDLRQDVWSHVKLDDSLQRRNFYYFAGATCKLFILTLLIILLAVIPLSRDVIPVTYETQETQKVQKAQPEITAQETKNQHTTTSNTGSIKQKKTASVRKSAVINSSSQSSYSSSLASASPPSVAKSVPYDKVFSLMQTGERALKNNKSVIKIDR